MKRIFIQWAGVAAAAVLLWRFRAALLYVLLILFGSILLAAAIYPLSARLKRKLSQTGAIFAAWGIVAAGVAVLLAVISPAVIRQYRLLLALWPKMYSWFSQSDIFQLSADTVPELLHAFGCLGNGISHLLLAASTLGMMWLISIFLLKDRERYLLMAELFIPYRYRKTGLRLAKRIKRELNLFVGGQLRVCLWVAALNSFGLMLLQIPGALVLGLIAGLCNLIPYFGPFIAAVPILLVALTRGWQRMLFAALIVFTVQQIDGFLLSPRIMSGSTGLSPVCVLLVLAAGSAAFGIPGMILSVPTAMIVRIAYSEWVQNRKNIDPERQN